MQSDAVPESEMLEAQQAPLNAEAAAELVKREANRQV